jgi:thiamine-monophosphate kinase
VDGPDDLRLGPGGEFDLIRRLVGRPGPLPPGVTLGPGDDCAVLEGGLVVSVDLSLEGVHFRRSWISLEEAGYRATAGALSDLAAMAAEPLGVLLSMAVDPEEVEGAAVALQAGAVDACGREGVGILGGDLSRSPGPLVLDVVVLGRTAAPLLRRGCLPGDELWVTGWLGGSAAAVESWRRGVDPPSVFRDAFASPKPRIREARWLADRAPLHAGIDLSDGLAGDAGHLAAASGVALILEAEALPLSPELESRIGDRAGALRLALQGGEDYELCLAAAPGFLGPLAASFRDEFGIPLTRIGRAAEGAGVRMEGPPDRGDPGPAGGFSHFEGREKG